MGRRLRTQEISEISDSNEFKRRLGICALGSPATTLRPLHLNGDHILDLAIRYEVRSCPGEKDLDVVYRFLIHDGNYGFEDAPASLTPAPGIFFPNALNLDFQARDENSDGISELFANDQGTLIYSRKIQQSMLMMEIIIPILYCSMRERERSYEALLKLPALMSNAAKGRWFNADGDDDLDLLVYKIGSEPGEEENYKIPYWIFSPKISRYSLDTG